MTLTFETFFHPGLFQKIWMVLKQPADTSFEMTEKYELEREFKLIIEKNRHLIDKICFYYASDDQDFEDLHQDIYINIWRGIVSFRHESTEATWIYRICLNTCVSSWRKNKRHKGGLSIERIVEPYADDNSAIENGEQLHYLISLLGPTEKSLLLMWLDERSYDEIAEVTGYNRNTVATKLRRIKEKLSNIVNSKDWEL